MNKITSADIKLRLLQYFRFKRSMLCGTEVYCGPNISDVIAIDPIKKISYDIEVKVNYYDFSMDFKKVKHKSMELGLSDINYFYFAVTKELYDKIVNEVPDYCGLIIINGEITIMRRGKKFKVLDSCFDKLYKNLILRINNQLITELERNQDE